MPSRSSASAGSDLPLSRASRPDVGTLCRLPWKHDQHPPRNRPGIGATGSFMEAVIVKLLRACAKRDVLRKNRRSWRKTPSRPTAGGNVLAGRRAAGGQYAVRAAPASRCKPRKSQEEERISNSRTDTMLRHELFHQFDTLFHAADASDGRQWLKMLQRVATAAETAKRRGVEDVPDGKQCSCVKRQHHPQHIRRSATGTRCATHAPTAIFPVSSGFPRQ